MTASSVTGIGSGSVESVSTQSLNKTNIIFAGKAKSGGPAFSPSGYGGTCVFPSPLLGSADSYIVIITTLNGGSSYVSSLNVTSNSFLGFDFVTEYESEIMYIVTYNNT